MVAGFCSNGGMKETVLYGVRTGNEAWQEELLCTQPERFEEVKVLASKDGFGRFRIATVDLSEKPDFKKTINL